MTRTGNDRRVRKQQAEMAAQGAHGEDAIRDALLATLEQFPEAKLAMIEALERAAR